MWKKSRKKDEKEIQITKWKWYTNGNSENNSKLRDMKRGQNYKDRIKF